MMRLASLAITIISAPACEAKRTRPLVTTGNKFGNHWKTGRQHSENKHEGSDDKSDKSGVYRVKHHEFRWWILPNVCISQNPSDDNLEIYYRLHFE